MSLDPSARFRAGPRAELADETDAALVAARAALDRLTGTEPSALWSGPGGLRSLAVGLAA